MIDDLIRLKYPHLKTKFTSKSRPNLLGEGDKVVARRLATGPPARAEMVQRVSGGGCARGVASFSLLAALVVVVAAAVVVVIVAAAAVVKTVVQQVAGAVSVAAAVGVVRQQAVAAVVHVVQFQPARVRRSIGQTARTGRR